jgi:hypothetical protein
VGDHGWIRVEIGDKLNESSDEILNDLRLPAGAEGDFLEVLRLFTGALEIQVVGQIAADVQGRVTGLLGEAIQQRGNTHPVIFRQMVDGEPDDGSNAIQASERRAKQFGDPQQLSHFGQPRYVIIEEFPEKTEISVEHVCVGRPRLIGGRHGEIVAVPISLIRAQAHSGSLRSSVECWRAPMSDFEFATVGRVAS